MVFEEGIRVEGTKINQHKWKLSSTNEGETIVVASKSDVLFIVLVEEAWLYIYSSSIDWVLDSGVYHHVTPCKNNFSTYEEVDHGRVHLGNNHFSNIVGVKDVWIKTKDGQGILLK